jgi:hypothetical protein
VIADDVEHGAAADEIASLREGLGVAEGGVLFDEGDGLAALVEQVLEAGGVTGGDDEGDAIDEGFAAFGQEKVESELGDRFEPGALAGEGLVHEVALAGACRSNDCRDTHTES